MKRLEELGFVRKDDRSFGYVVTFSRAVEGTESLSTTDTVSIRPENRTVELYRVHRYAEFGDSMEPMPVDVEIMNAITKELEEFFAE